MSQTPCPVSWCDRPRPGHAQICGACAAELIRNLESVPDLVRDLAITYSRQSSMGGSGRRTEMPVPFDARAVEAADVLRSALVGWIRILLDETTVRPIPEGPNCDNCTHSTCRDIAGARYAEWFATPPANTMPALAAWLLQRRQQLIGHAVAEEAVEEIGTAVRLAERITDRPMQSRYAGPCNCGAGLYAHPGAARVTCRDCELVFDVAAQREWMLGQVADMLATPSQAAHLISLLNVPLKAPTIRKWVERDRLIPHGTDPGGRALYRIGDVLELQAEMLAREADRQTKQAQRVSA